VPWWHVSRSTRAVLCWSLQLDRWPRPLDCKDARSPRVKRTVAEHQPDQASQQILNSAIVHLSCAHSQGNGQPGAAWAVRDEMNPVH